MQRQGGMGRKKISGGKLGSISSFGPFHHPSMGPAICCWKHHSILPLATDTRGWDLLRVPAQEEGQWEGEDTHSRGLLQCGLLLEGRPPSFSLCSGLGLQCQENFMFRSTRNAQYKNLPERNAATLKWYVLSHSSTQTCFQPENVFF